MRHDGVLEELVQRLDRVERRVGMSEFEVGLLDRLDRLEANMILLQQQGIRIMEEMTALIAEVAAEKTVMEGGVTAINRLLDIVNGQVQAATELEALKTQIAETVATMKTNAAPLADAVASVPPAA